MSGTTHDLAWAATDDVAVTGYRILRDEDDKLLVEGFTEHATVGPDGRPTRMPEDLRLRLSTGEAPK